MTAPRLLGLACFALLLAGPGTTLAARDSLRGGTRVSVNAGGVTVEQGGGSDTFRFDRVNVNDRTRVRILDKDGAIIVDDDDAMVRMFSDITVDSGERVDGDVVAILGSITVRGEVTGNVVAVGGSVALEPGARVEGDAVAVGGVLEQETGAQVGGESVSVGFLPLHFGVPTLSMLLGLVLAGWLLTVFIGWLFTLITPERTVRVGATVSRRTGLSLVLGLLALPAFAVAAFLLFVTVVGIPVGILLPVLYLVMLAMGHTAATAVLGSRLLRRPLTQGSPLAAIAAGSAFVALFFAAAAVLSGPPGVVRTVALFFGTLGGLLVLGLSTIGIGAVMVSRFGSDPADIRFGTPVVPAAPAAPIPSPSPGV